MAHGGEQQAPLQLVKPDRADALAHSSPLTMATNGTSSPSMAGSEPSVTGSVHGAGGAPNDAHPGAGGLKAPIIFVLRCPECNFETLRLDRLRTHFPCALRDSPSKFFVYRCDACRSISTSRLLMEEHKELYHKHPSEITISEIPDQIESINSLNPGFGFDMGPHCLNPLSVGSTNHLMCPICRTPFRSPKELGTHFEVVHRSMMPPPNRSFMPPFFGNAASAPMFGNAGGGATPQQFICYMCSAVFSEQEALSTHIVRSHKDMMVAMVNELQNVVSTNKMAAALNNASEVYDVDMECASPLKEMPKLTAASVASIGASPNVTTAAGCVTAPHVLAKPPRTNSHVPGSPPSLLSSAGALPGSGSSPLAASAATASYPTPISAAVTASGGTPGGLGLDSRNSILPRAQPLPLHNTIRKTKSDMKVINRFLASKGEERDVCDMSMDELNAHLQDFILNARKKDNNDYEPESLKAFIHSLERHLKTNNYPYSVLRDAPFSHTRSVLHSRLQSLRQASRSQMASGGCAGRGGQSSSSNRQTYTELVKAGTLGHDSPQALLHALFVINKKFFGIKGPGRHKMLTWGQFSFGEIPIHGEVLQFRCDAAGLRQYTRAAGINFPLDVIQTFRIYENLRPVEARNFSDPFYLSIDPAWEHGGSWFRPAPLGMAYLQRIPRLLTNRIVAPPAGSGGVAPAGEDSCGSTSAEFGGPIGAPAAAPALAAVGGAGNAGAAGLSAAAAVLGNGKIGGGGGLAFDSELPSMVPQVSSFKAEERASPSPE